VNRSQPDMCTGMISTVTRSKVKIKVTELLKFRKLFFLVYLLRHFGVDLKTDGWLWWDGTYSTACRSQIFGL